MFTYFYFFNIFKIKMKKILIKEIDRYYSSLDKTKYISEYLIYFKLNDKNIECESVIGNDGKRDVVHEMILKHFNDYDKQQIINSIEEITL